MIKRRESKHTTPESYCFTKDSKRGRKEQKNYKAVRNQVLSPDLFIIAFNVSGLESPIKGREWLDGLKKSRPIWC